MSEQLAEMRNLIREALAVARNEPGHDAEIIADKLGRVRLTHATMRALWDEAYAAGLAAGIPRQGEAASS